MAQEIMRASGTLARDEHPRDATPRSRDRVVEFVIAVCIIGVLQALYLLNNAAMPDKARMTSAFSSKSADQIPVLETLALEGSFGGLVSVVANVDPDVGEGTVAGLKFFTAEEPLYVVNWQCKQATAQEVAEAVKALPETKRSAYKLLTPVELPADHQLKVCQQGSGSAR